MKPIETPLFPPEYCPRCGGQVWYNTAAHHENARCEIVSPPAPSTVASIRARLEASRFDLSTLTPAERALLIRAGGESRKDQTPMNAPTPEQIAAIVAKLKAARYDLSVLTPGDRAALNASGAGRGATGK